AHAWLPERAVWRSAVCCVPRTQLITDPQKEPKMSAQSCDQLCPITTDHIPSSAICQCPSVPALSAHQCHLPVSISATSVPHFSAHQCYINATCQCPSELPFSVTDQCQSVPPINASQCCLSVCISAAYQC
ncbi:unnamed protein product, partial [Staurois parvus]